MLYSSSYSTTSSNTKSTLGPRVLPKLPQKGECFILHHYENCLNSLEWNVKSLVSSVGANLRLVVKHIQDYSTGHLDFLTFEVGNLYRLRIYCSSFSVALRKTPGIVPSVDKPNQGPEVLQKPTQVVDIPTRDTITRPTEPPPKIPQAAERPQPAEIPPKPHVLELPPKPQLSDLPPKPQLSELPPKPQLSDLPPKPQLKDLPPKPQLSDLAPKVPASTATETPQKQPTLEETAPKVQVTEAQTPSQHEELSPRQASEDTNGAPAGVVEMPVPLPRKINTVSHVERRQR